MKRKETKYIIIHCTANRPGCKMTIDDFRHDHISRGYSDIGYHFVVFEDGSIKPGRPIEDVGAHCLASGRNKDSIGIAYVGGIDEFGVTADTRTDAQKDSLRLLIDLCLRMYPGALVRGHRDFDRGRVCPCFTINNDNWRVV